MEKLAKTLLILGLAYLPVACTSISSGDPVGQSKWQIAQNIQGKFVYCQTNRDCPKRTEKSFAVKKESVVKPQVAQKQENKILAKVFFKFGSAVLDKRSAASLTQVLPNLKNTDDVVVLRGWTDPVAGKNSKVNQKLARKRANNTKAWLLKKGVKAQIHIETEPPCCNNQTATEHSPESIRKHMRVVTIELQETLGRN